MSPALTRGDPHLVIVPQSAIFAVGTSSHCFLEFSAHRDVATADVIGALADLEAPHTTVGGANLVVGVRPSMWARVAPDAVPALASDFDQPIVGPDGFTMPATQRDAWVWVSGAAADLIFDVSLEVVAALAPMFNLATDVTGWSYRHSRDLTGFEDGTENPSLSQAPAVALVADGEPGQGSSVVLVQQWRHDTAAWESLSIANQEKVIGRTKADSVELDAATQPPDSHVSRTVIEGASGDELDIFRRNVPYGTLTDHGTMFVGFSFDQPRMIRMLHRMAGSEGDVRDALTRYTTPLTGAYYVVPEIGRLAAFATRDK